MGGLIVHKHKRTWNSTAKHVGALECSLFWPRKLQTLADVALRRSDWDREWDQIWLEVLQEGGDSCRMGKIIHVAAAACQSSEEIAEEIESRSIF